MGGGGSAAAMNTVINNNRKLLKRKAREKMAYNGLVTNENYKGYTFDQIIYNGIAKNNINELIANRKKENLRTNILGIVFSIIFIGLLWLLYKLHQQSMA